MRSLKALVLLALALVVGCAPGQSRAAPGSPPARPPVKTGSLRVQVLGFDGKEYRPLPAAQVSVPEMGESMLTDAEGYTPYMPLSDDLAAEYTVTVTRLGFSRLTARHLKFREGVSTLPMQVPPGNDDLETVIFVD